MCECILIFVVCTLFCTDSYVLGRRGRAISKDVIGALKYFFHARRRGVLAPSQQTSSENLFSVHWEGSIKLFMKVPLNGDIMSPTYGDGGMNI